jgi:hypothetical protein
MKLEELKEPEVFTLNPYYRGKALRRSCISFLLQVNRLNSLCHPRVYFKTAQEAEAAGYTKAGNCNQ